MLRRGKNDSPTTLGNRLMFARLTKDHCSCSPHASWGASVYFSLGVERMKAAITHTDASAFADGDEVKIIAVIDGDELSVRSQTGRTTVVRLLGIKSFHRTSYDRLFGQYGRQSFDHLTSRWLNRP